MTAEGVFDGQPAEKIQVAPWDGHPTPFGHELIAERLYGELMRENAGALGLDSR
jgi:hypothetical protein